MDVATVIGLVSAVGLMVAAILTGGQASFFWSFPSLLIVVGGTVASTLIHYPLKDLMAVWACLKQSFFYESRPSERTIRKLVDLATLARKEGVLALESYIRSERDPFVRRGFELAIDGTPPELLRGVLMTEVAFMEDRHQASQSILLSMGSFAPAYGMIGTLIGLIHMFTTLDDPSRIGQGMALAILTTLYGVLLANIVFVPAAGKLRVRTNEELLEKEIIVEGITSIQAGDNPYVVEHKLKSFVAPAVRERIRTSR